MMLFNSFSGGWRIINYLSYCGRENPPAGSPVEASRQLDRFIGAPPRVNARPLRKKVAASATSDKIRNGLKDASPSFRHAACGIAMVYQHECLRSAV
jgi:hypothetical protein